jgi:hypothetical protein
MEFFFWLKFKVLMNESSVTVVALWWWNRAGPSQKLMFYLVDIPCMLYNFPCGDVFLSGE